MGAEPRPDFDEIVRVYRTPLQRYLQQRVNSAEDAEDLLQEVLLSGYRGYARFRGDCSLSTWLYRLAQIRCLSYWRVQGRKKRAGYSEMSLQRLSLQLEITESDLPDTALGPEGWLLQQEQEQLIWEQIALLKPRSQKALLESLFSELTLVEQARRQGLTTECLKARVHEGRSRVRKALLAYRREDPDA